jgi:hypothetical protein
MKHWMKIDEDTPRDTRILLYKKARKWGGTYLVVVGELTEYNDVTHHLWGGLYGDAVERFKRWVSPKWNEKFTHWMPLED